MFNFNPANLGPIPPLSIVNGLDGNTESRDGTVEEYLFDKRDDFNKILNLLS